MQHALREKSDPEKRTMVCWSIYGFGLYMLFPLYITVAYYNFLGCLLYVRTDCQGLCLLGFFSFFWSSNWNCC